MKNERHSIAYKALLTAREEYNHALRMIETDRICLVDAESDPWCNVSYIELLKFELSEYRSILKESAEDIKHWKKEIKLAQLEYNQKKLHETR